MGYDSDIHLHMIFIIMFVLFSLNNGHNMIANALSNASEDLSSVSGMRHLYSMADIEDGIPTQIEKVSGEDGNEEHRASILEKFRVLLGLNNSYMKWPLKGHGYSESVSPAPSPSTSIDAEAPTPAPAPAPVLHHHAHSHPPLHHLRSTQPPHKLQREDQGKVRRILIAVLVSVGTATVICVLGLIWACKKYRKHQKRPTRTIPACGKRRRKSKYASFRKPASKVRLNPGLDLFYLDSLGLDLEQQQQTTTTCLANASLTHSIAKNALHERVESNQESVKAEIIDDGTSSTREIKSVHEDADLINHESGCPNSSCEEKIISIETRSSDDESFHSFGDSNSSIVRLSNASAASVGDTFENFSPRVLTNSCLEQSCVDLPIVHANVALDLPIQQANPNQNSSPAPDSQPPSNAEQICQKNSTTPPPPPPPPPPPTLSPPLVHFLPSHSSPRPARAMSNASSSSTMPNLSSPRNSHFSPKSSQNSQAELPPSPQNPFKPSQSPSCIPPPPCPPPFFNANSNCLKTPPPPPSQFPQFSPLGKGGSPLPKLKPLHWDKVRAAPDRSMVWDKLRSSSFELDEEMIESLFGYNIQKSIKNDEAKSKSPSPSKHVLEPKRLQNITILSKALNVTAAQVCEALVQGKGLSLQQLEALAKMVPIKEEEAQLSGYKGDINELGSAERFVKAMLDIPYAFLRVEAMLYRETFEDEVVHLRNSFSMLEEACKELRSSRLFLKLLEAVLKTGNRMNVGTIRGGARAFKLDALLKLADVKGTDGKTTLLHFVVQEIIRSEGIRVSTSIMGRINQKNKIRTPEEQEEDYRRMGLDLVSGLSTELYNVKKTATIDLDVLASSVSNLSDGMAKLQDLICKDLCVDGKGGSGNFINSMNAFLNYAEKNLKELQGDEDRVLSHVKEITEYFHGDVSREEGNPLRIFVIVRDFLGMLDHVCKELRSARAPRTPNPLAPFR
ncbi:hypothetical protein FNV43_RR04967 [Rhamnella rubrinervis]|uniref:Formin-like protein n=1 Tax=Rhamnella rubrinervis TaxID=2594499 RepID=A0A8K0MQM5_9ROSA|nr:hypothetical protein FNV43_RR04967 [Rhamnella rubrinervis]